MAKDALFEIGLEELPARFIDQAESQLRQQTEQFLKTQRLSYTSLQSFSTPRRLAVLIQGLAETQTTIEEEVKGPAAAIARDDAGNWTKAAIGFTKGQGVTVDDIYEKEIKGTAYIHVKKKIEGKPTLDLLPQFETIITAIQFNKNMRWGEETLRYARPIRWLVGMYGTDVIPFNITGVHSSNVTYGHRFLGGKIILNEANDYVDVLKAQYVIVDSSDREEMIMTQIKEVATEKGIHVPVDHDLLEEVRNLVEFPTIFVGAFDNNFLELPADILITSMKEHQRYFPVKDQDGKLLPLFIGVRNGDHHALETVIRGNEKVLRARLSDAQFFYEEDQKTPLDIHLEKLDRVIFQEKLGTLADKVVRVRHIAGKIADKIDLTSEVQAHVERAAHLCKFDLMTQMVNEFTELQGVMGEDYALKYGEHPGVAAAIREHYLPKHASGALPETVEGSVLSIADKLDTITGCLAVGLKPSASQDPYGLRRQATGILRILEEKGWSVELEDLLDIAIKLYASLDLVQMSEQHIKEEVIAFFHTRASYLLRDHQIEQDVVHAIIHHKIGRYPYAVERAHLLSVKRHEASFKPTQEALVRVLNISKKAETSHIDPDLFQTDSERALYEAFTRISPLVQSAQEEANAADALHHLEKLTEPIHHFFEQNMVMADDARVRKNRLALLHAIANVISNYADLSLVEWKQQF
ncbi:glycine--tRNA ligase subunit beta [Lentibacillus saliphilus]|uniref:glycine--tRNA ligase subunit beta n=1 Tax=Lentibacillus saliphilus TaxID=2737028 RepID=UPI001C308FF9|nr:glycine--tRNA ligase subunit beta [Lentibacillus saliphilus]